MQNQNKDQNQTQGNLQNKVREQETTTKGKGMQLEGKDSQSTKTSAQDPKMNRQDPEGQAVRAGEGGLSGRAHEVDEHDADEDELLTDGSEGGDTAGTRFAGENTKNRRPAGEQNFSDEADLPTNEKTLTPPNIQAGGNFTQQKKASDQDEKSARPLDDDYLAADQGKEAKQKDTSASTVSQGAVSSKASVQQKSQQDRPTVH